MQTQQQLVLGSKGANLLHYCPVLYCSMPAAFSQLGHFASVLHMHNPISLQNIAEMVCSNLGFQAREQFVNHVYLPGNFVQPHQSMATWLNCQSVQRPESELAMGRL